MRLRLLVLAFAAVLASSCDSTNPVEPPPTNAPPPPGGGSGGGVTVTVTSNLGSVPTNSTAGATLTFTAKNGDGSPVANGTEVVANTNLGSFGTDNLGNPLQLVRKTLAGGSATAPFFPGTTIGTAAILAQVGTSSGRLNLPIVEPATPPVAEFSFEVSDLSVIFADASTGTPTAWSWDFGDGGTSTRQNPLHTYAEAGTYTVSLTVTAAGGESRKRKFVSVEAGDTLMADFGYTISGLTVLFSDSSSGKPTSFSWDFGDNATSSVRDPSHTYARAGTYTVTLTVANDFGVTDSASQFVSPSLGAPPVADFSAQTSGLSVLFTDKSTGSPTSWTWSFGDGASSATQHPSHTYAAAGSYNVTLTAASTAGSSMKTQVVTVSLGDPPVADFEFQVNGFTVVFVDRSTKSPTSWSWDFGECTQPQCQSTQPNPTYTYSQSGTFTVVLTASNAAGSSQKAKLVTIAGTTSPMTRFCYQRNGLAVLFTDASGGTPTEWDWDFGDCTTPSPACTSSAQNPGHTYAAMGTYTVTLRTRNAGGQSALSKFVTVDPSVTDAAPRCN